MVPLSAEHNHHNGDVDEVVAKLFCKGSRCSQREVDEFFRNKPMLTISNVGEILDSSVGLQKRSRIDVLKKIHLVHITDELRRLRQGSQKPNAFQITAMVRSLQVTTRDDAQTSGVYGDTYQKYLT